MILKAISLLEGYNMDTIKTYSITQDPIPKTKKTKKVILEIILYYIRNNIIFNLAYYSE